VPKTENKNSYKTSPSLRFVKYIKRVYALYGSAASVVISSRYLFTWLHFSEGRSEGRFVLRGGRKEIRQGSGFCTKTRNCLIVIP